MRTIGDYIWFQNNFVPHCPVSIGKIIEIRHNQVVVVEVCGDGKEIYLGGGAVNGKEATPEEVLQYALER